MTSGNLFGGVPTTLAEEFFQVLLHRPGLRIERILSRQHATPAGQWYDQEWDEWVVLLRGSAGLCIEGQEAEIVLKPGDHLLLPAHLRHRVEWTSPYEDTLWLAVHFAPAIE